MSYTSIREHLEELYGLEVSEASLTAITDKILPVVEAWRTRPLEPVWCFVWLDRLGYDAIHFKVRENHKVVSKAAYTVLGVSVQGQKELLGIYVAESESARLWLTVLADLQSRGSLSRRVGMEDILIACIDNLTGFAQAIESVFPHTDVQLCLVHQSYRHARLPLRNSLRYVTSGDQKQVSQDLQAVYKAPNLSAAEAKLEEFKNQWEEKYPLVLESWQRNKPMFHRYQVDASDALLRLSTCHPQGNLHDQYGRRLSPTVAASDQDQGHFFLGDGLGQAALPGLRTNQRKMDHATCGDVLWLTGL